MTLRREKQKINRELKQLGLQYNDDPNSADFEELEYILTQIIQFPLTELAILHREANRLGEYDLKLSGEHQEQQKNNLLINSIEEEVVNAQYCSDCGFIKQEYGLKLLSHDISDIKNIGVSTFLFFRFMRRLGIFAVEMLLVYSTFAVITNYLAFQNDRNIYDNRTFISYSISLGAKQYNISQGVQNTFFVSEWLLLAYLIIQILTLFYVRYHEAQGEVQQIIESKSAADYSIAIKNAPINLTKDQFQRQLNEYLYEKQADQFISVVKINSGKPFYEVQANLDDELYKSIKKQLSEKRQVFIGILLERKESIYFQTTQGDRKRLYNEYSKLKTDLIKEEQKVIKRIKDQFGKHSLVPKTMSFVTFESNQVKNRLLQMLQSSKIKQFCEFITFGCYSSDGFKITTADGQSLVSIEKAPEPEDIIWKNIGVPKSEIVKRKIINLFITIVILSISLFCQFKLNLMKSDANLSISILLTLFNLILGYVISFMTAYERDYTYTHYQTSLALKAIAAQLLNSILFPIVVNLSLNNIYNSSGLAQSVFYFSITNALAPPIMKIINPSYLISKFQRWRYQNPQTKITIKQLELNATFQYLQIELGFEYVFIVNTFLFTCFFIVLQPIIVYFTVLAFFLMYWAQKFCLYNLSKRPVPGTDLLNSTINKMLAAGGLFIAVGNYFSQSLVIDGSPLSASVPSLIILIVGLVMLLAPYDLIFRNYIKEKVVNEPLNLYWQNRIFLPSEYDRLNPATAEQSIEEYIQFINGKQKEFSKKNLSDQFDIINNFRKQGKRYHRRQHNLPFLGASPIDNDSCFNYYLTNVSNNTINPRLIGSVLFPQQIANPLIKNSPIESRYELRSANTKERPQIPISKLENPVNSLAHWQKNGNTSVIDLLRSKIDK